MNTRATLATALIVVCGGCATVPVSNPLTPRAQVTATERAFARTMADRDHTAFVRFLADETVFLSGDETLRGAPAVAAGWRRYFDGEQAPFSWAPESVEVLDSGGLALSTGPVWNAAGERVATFTSIWRRHPDGTWRIVFDRGNRYCE